MSEDSRHELERLRAQNQRLQFLADFSHKLLSVQTPEEFVRQVFEPLSEHLGLEVYVNFLVSEDGAHLELDSSNGLSDEVAESIRKLDFGVAVCGNVALQECPIIAEGVQRRSDEMTELIRELGITAYACHPLIVGGKLIGTLSFGSRERDHFERDEIELMRAACDQVAAAIDRTRLLAKLREQTERLAEADARKDRFLAMLAHELRNPMAPILTASRILAEGDEAAAARARAVIERQAQHMSRLVDDLLDVSRITRGRILIQKRAVDLGEVVRSAAQSCEPLFEERHQQVDVDAGTPVEITGDAARLEQVAVNLMANASKYTPPEGRIRVAVRREGGEGVFTVSDTGIGISTEELGRVFDMFYQSDSDGARTDGGLGVGLTLVQSLVELHGGRVAVRSEGPDQGSEFEVRIPVSAPIHDPADAPQAVREGELAGRSLLLVEDNPDAAEMLRMLLELRGARVVVAHDGPSALELARRESPELAIVDLGLPGMSGIEVGRCLRAEREGIGLVALSGYATREDRAKTRAAGFDVHLAKPADAETLKRVILNPTAPLSQS